MRLTVPNQLTLLRIILTPIFIYFFHKNTPSDQLFASVLFLMASLTDWYDGWYARKFGVITRWGQFMDPLADKILVTSALIIFAVLNYIFAWMVWIIAVRDGIVTTVRIYALYVGKPIITHILAKWKTFLQMTTIFLILIFVNWHNFYFKNPGSYSAQYFDVIGIAMLIVTGLTVISGLIYLIENRGVMLNMVRKLFPF